MSKNISLLGQNYLNVPGVKLPQTNGEMAYFADVTDTTAVAADVAQGKIFYAANGTQQTGTAVMGGGSAISVVDTQDSNGGTIRTITAVDLSADTVTAATLLQGYTAHDRLGNAITGTASGGGSEFIITLTKNASTGVWEPDCTYAEMYAAYTGGKIVVVTADDTPCEISIIDDPAFRCNYSVMESNYDAATGTDSILSRLFSWTSSGVTELGADPAYYTYDATATPSDVASGKVFYNSSGKQTGTASGSSASLQTKSVTPSESSQTVTADSGYDGLSSVSVGAISSTYVGSGIDRRSSTNLTVSGATVTAPAGYYAEAATKSVASGSASTPATTITTNPTISVSSSGLITASVSGSKSITPTVSAGYVSSGTAGTVSVSGSNTQQLTTKATATIYPSTTDQTIASGTYLTGTQTIKAVTVSGLSAGNIASGVTVKVGDSTDDDRITSVTGTLSFATYYTGSSDPSASIGANGDIYLKVVT